MFKKMFTLLIAVLFVIPFAVIADDFDDDFGGDEEESEEAEEEDEEEASSKKKSKEMSESDAAMKDLMGDSEEEKPAEEEKESKNVEKAAPAEKAAAGKSFKGVKPVLLVKGGFAVMGQYKVLKEGTTKPSTMNSMFGSVDEGILGVDYQGAHVIARGTLNLRTNNALIEEAVNNPLMKENLHSIQDGVANALYEVYGGVKFYDVFIKAGKMLPEYGLVDTWQELGMGFSTPFLTRSLIVVEGFLPETDAGIALGYNSIIKNDHNIFVGLSLGTGSNKSEFWYSDKTLGIYGRIGYGFKDYLKAAFAFQYRTDYFQYKDGVPDSKGKLGKNVDLIGIGVHLRGGYAGFEMPLTFDYNIMKMVDGTAKTLKTNLQGMLFSAAPGYAYHFNHEWVDKVALALRFDFVKGVYLSKDGGYIDSTNFKAKSSYFRIGVTANFFTKELAGVRAMAGLTFLMQPETKVTKTQKDYGFTTVVLQAGAEF